MDDEAGPTPTPEHRHAVEARLTKVLARDWAPIPNALIRHLGDVGGHWSSKTEDGELQRHPLKPVHFFVLCFLLSAKRDAEDPFPSAKYIANAGGLSYTTVLHALDDLERAKLLLRYPRPDPEGTGRTRYAYDLSPLFERLEKLAEADQAKRDKRSGIVRRRIEEDA